MEPANIETNATKTSTKEVLITNVQKTKTARNLEIRELTQMACPP